MFPLLRALTRRLPLIFGLIAIWFAVERWLWFQSLPRLSPTRFCGNCFIGAVVMPLELGLCGAVVALASIFRIRWCRADIVNWCIVAFGSLSTPAFIGLPIFALGLASLIYEKLLPCSTAAASSPPPPAQPVPH
jgi:hypothetical protein